MSELHTFLSELRSSGVQLWLYEDQIRYRSRSGTLELSSIDMLRRHKTEMIALLREPVASRTAPLAGQPRPAVLPLSYAQEGLWFLDQLGLHGPAYNVRTVLSLEGNFDLVRFDRAVKEVVRRHEILRTKYGSMDGVGTMVIIPPSAVQFKFIDFSSLSETERQKRTRDLLGSLARDGFDIASKPPFDIHVLRTGPRAHVLVMRMHHIMIDGPSFWILFRELGILYKEYAEGHGLTLPEPVAQYADYVLWQRRYLQGDVVEKQLSYWRRRLSGATEDLALPFDRTPPPTPSHRGATLEFSLPKALSDSLRAIARAQNTTLFMVFLAACQALLSRWSGQRDVSVGLAIDGRGHQEAETMIGYFLNTVVLRVELSSGSTFLDLLEEVKNRLVEAYEHRDLPFERLVSELRPERRLSRQPLFQVLFTFMTWEEPQFPGLKVALAPDFTVSVDPFDQTAKFDLSFFVAETPEGISGGVEYATDLFDRETIERLIGHFKTLLEGVVSDPEARVDELPLLSDAERRQLIVEWNATAAPSPWVDQQGADVSEASSLQGLFAQQARATPSAIAVVHGEEQLTYGELEARANQLAHHLQGLGVGPETLVGILVERSLAMVVGVLAVLKAGGAYLPLDPEYPTARLAFMLADSHAPVLLTQACYKTLPFWPEASGPAQATVVCLDTDWPAIAAHPATPPMVHTHPLHLAYCIYTSGSTGMPKGVGLQQANVVAFLGWAVQVFEREETARVLFSTSICFDLSIFELFLPLVTGGTVLLVRDVLALVDAPIMPGPTLINLVPSAAQALLAADAVPASVRSVTLAGEPLRHELAVRLAESGARPRVYNLYGPTEYTTYTTWCAVDAGPVTIGRPVTNTQVYLLDGELVPVPVGVSGEIYIAGEGLARGYLHRPATTAERFMPNPFGRPGSRLYRTGDRGRYRRDGMIEFLGRLDHQVKLRGYRIELGEVEEAIRGCDGVEDVAVIVHEPFPGDPRLVAYVAGRQGDPRLTDQELEARLRSRLPTFMVPGLWVVLTELPRTPTGKLDRQALSAAEVQLMPRTKLVRPRTPTEGMLAAIWAEVLGTPEVGIHDNFFALGGHSLLATQVIARIRRTLQRDLPLRQLFAAPTVAELATLVSAAQMASHTLIPPRRGSSEMSFAQQRLWFLDQFAPGTALYSLPAAWRLRGPLDHEALRCSLQEIARRHEVLRTTFTGENGLPIPVVRESCPLVLPMTDVSSSANPAADPEAEMARLVDEEARTPFDLAHGPLMRAGLIRLGDQEHVLLITLHHVIADGWSFDVLLRELGALYQAFRAGQPSPLSQLPLQYLDYAAWQRDLLQDTVLAGHLEYWKHYLEGAPRTLELPTDRPRPPVATYGGGCVSFLLDTVLSGRLRALSRRLQVTLFMTLAAAFNLLLHRWSGQDDLCVGYPVANRTHPEIEGLIGLFVNTLVLRTRTSPTTNFEALLRQVRESLLDADAHRELPFEKLVEELRPERDLSRQPVFQVALNDLEQKDLTLSNLELSPVAGSWQTAKFDLSFFVAETPEGISGGVEYATDLFDRETIERLIGHFKTLLEGVVSDPEARVDELPLLSDAERRQLIVEWNATAAPSPWVDQQGADVSEASSLQGLFAQQARATPSAIAVVHGEEQLTYGELEARANQLAHHLQGLGVGPETLVGILVERSLAMVVGVLAVLKAGGAYLPLDPEYPTARLAFMLADSHAPVLLTQACYKTLPFWPEASGPAQATVVCLDTDWPAIAAHPATPPMVHTHPLHLAYCIYTSGSTGMPKGVGLQQANVVAFLGWAVQVFEREETARVLFSTSICFDLSIFELFLPLVTGGTVLLVRDVLALVDAPIMPGPTLINLVPSAAQALLAADAVPASVRSVTLAGEPLRHELAVRLAESGARPRVYNLYGPTEYTTYTTWCAVDAGPVTIGRPVTNTQVYLLDGELVPVPVGVSGEIYIAGEGLARGYLHRPATTAERFMPNPFGRPGSRLYRTGDRGRYRRDGMIEFLGRLDHQVKLRGYRIELGEVEEAIRGCDGVEDVAVIVHEPFPGDPRLVAYVAGRQGDPRLTDQELEARLRSRLPTFMVPGLWVVLTELPRTPTGKLDRQALSAAEVQLMPRTKLVRPRTPTEGMLAAIWAEVLGTPEVGIHDNFFALGGHSLLATQVIARIRRTLQRDLPLRQLFAAPTVAELATLVSAAQMASHTLIPPRRGSSEMSFAQQRLWFLDQFAPGTALYSLPAAWRLRGPLDHEALRCSLQEIARRHEVLRTTFTGENGLPIPVVRESCPLVLPMTDVSSSANPAADPEAEMARLVDEEARTPFDLAHGPLMRAGLIRLGDQEHVLLITLHHVIADGWSFDVLLRELGALYQAFRAGQPSPLSQLPLQYLDYAAWQRDLLQDTVLAGHLEYWKHYLEGAPRTLELPTDRPRPPVATYGGGCVSFLLDTVLSGRLRALSRRLQVTLFMTLAAAFNLLLHRWSGQDDLCVGYPVANRTHPEIEGLIGLFVNTLVLRTRTSPTTNFEALLRQVRESLLDADAHRELPFEKLVEELRPERDLSRQPVFQVALNDLEQKDLTLSNLELSPVAGSWQTAKFDLSFFVAETPEGISGGVEYATDLFDRETIERLIGHFKTLLEGVVSDPEARVDELPLLSDAERRQLIVEWNATAAPSPWVDQQGADVSEASSLQGLFAQQARATPSAIAVVHGEEQLTYGELEARANQLAHHLQGLGVGPETLVGILVERSLAMVVGVLAVLKAGGAYLPLDPEYPTARLAFMLADSHAPVLLTQACYKTLPFWPEASGPAQATVVCLDTDWPAIAAHPATPPMVHTHPLHLAYCIYTSGSTGMPKGVQIAHSGVLNLVAWHREAYALGRGERVTQVAGFSFDACVWEVWGTLTAGATLCLIDETTRSSPSKIVRWLADESVSLSFLPTPMADAALLEEWPTCAPLRALLTGGDTLHLRPRASDSFRLINHYGPTETSVVATAGVVACSDDPTTQPSIGRPISNCRVYILDLNGEPVPIGATGQLHIGGAGLARGYLHRPDLTAERFVPDPFGGTPGDRLYATGDVGRYRTDGQIEIVGRMDHQVKIRGCRIEVGEIESVLLSHVGIRACVVVVVPAPTGDRRLVAYVVKEERANGNVNAWKNYLKERLPAYMVPSHLIELDALPKTPNGKIDRSALAAPEYWDRSAEEYVAPRSPLEQVIAEIWREVLGLDGVESHVGILDDFFELGGQSLLVMQVLSRIQAALGVEFSVRTFFEHPTVRELADTVVTLRWLAQGAPDDSVKVQQCTVGEI